jgi:hypothetical protein
VLVVVPPGVAVVVAPELLVVVPPGVPVVVAPELLVPALGLVELADVELLLPPQPASNAPEAAVTSSHVDSFRINHPFLRTRVARPAPQLRGSHLIG